MADFKGSNFDPISLIESASGFNIQHSEKILSDISDLCFELEALREAIFFKQQKMLQGLSKEKENMLDKTSTELSKAVEGISTQGIPRTAEILNKRKMLNELETIEKIMKYNLNTENSVDKVLESLLNSEDREDLKLLAEVINAHVNYNPGDNEIYITYSKKLEYNISNMFQKELKNENCIPLCKKYFDILQIVDKEFVLIDIFLLSKDLLATNSKITAPSLSEINISQDLLKDTEFHNFINQVAKILESCYEFICQVFELRDEYCEYIFTKISKTLININLTNFLNVSNAAIFLLALQTASTALLSFGNFINTLFPRINCEPKFNEILEQFVYKASLKEMHLFNEVLEIFLTGAKSLNVYTLDGAKVAKTNNYMRIYENMFVVLTAFMTRKEKLYTDENEAEVLKFCARKMSVLVDRLLGTDQSCWDIMYGLSHMHLMGRRMLGSKFALFEKLNEKIVDASRTQFEVVIDSLKPRLKGEIVEMSFDSGGSRLLKFLREIYKKSNELGDANRKLMFYKIVDTMYVFFVHKVEQTDLSNKKLDSALRCINEVSGYLTINVSPSLEPKFTRLKMIYELIAASPDQFSNLVPKYRSTLTDKEIREISKLRDCRAGDKNAQSTGHLHK